MTIRSVLSVAALAGGLLLTGCGSGNPPCEKLPNPSQAEIQAAREGAEVEREVPGNFGDAECVVVQNRWVDQTDDN